MTPDSKPTAKVVEGKEISYSKDKFSLFEILL